MNNGGRDDPWDGTGRHPDDFQPAPMPTASQKRISRGDTLSHRPTLPSRMCAVAVPAARIVAFFALFTVVALVRPIQGAASAAAASGSRQLRSTSTASSPPTFPSDNATTPTTAPPPVASASNASVPAASPCQAQPTSCACRGGCCCLLLPNSNSSSQAATCTPWPTGVGDDAADIEGASACSAAAAPPAAAAPAPAEAPAAPAAPGASYVGTLELSGPSGPSWSLSNANGSVANLAAAVPGYPLETLREAGLLGAPANDPRSDPLYRFNDVRFQWVAMDTWTLSTAFAVPPPPGEGEGGSAAGGPPAAAAAAADAGGGAAGTGVGVGDDGCGWDLVLEGVDTVADVLLNGRVLGQVKNFHRSYRLDVRHILRPPNGGLNDLSIVLHPAVPYVRQQAASYPYPMPSNTAPGSFGQFSFIRKPASDLGWDWGPAFAPAGVHGAVRLVRYCTPYVTGLHVVQQLHGAGGSGPPSDGGAAADAADGDYRTPGSGSISLILETAVWVPPPPLPPPPPPPGGSASSSSSSSTSSAAAAAPPPLVVVLELREPGGSGGGGGGGDGRLIARVEEPLTAPSSLEEGITRYVISSMTLDAAAVRLWWPVGFGDQPLYILSGWVQQQQAAASGSESGSGFGGSGPNASQPTGNSSSSSSSSSAGSTTSTDTTSSASTSTSTRATDGATNTTGGGANSTWQWQPAAGTGPQLPVSRRVGFRILELVTVPPEDAMGELSNLYGSKSGGTAADASGIGAPAPATPDFPKAPNETFYFRVNGAPVFARGANLIPLHVLHTDPRAGTAEGIAEMLAAALGAGMNMIRVWGGGRYQLDELYDMADAAGLLVWQEFMFACNPYPNTLDFQLEVQQEVMEQVRRLAGHPSVAIWGGNNEVEASFDWFPETRANKQLYASDFMDLFVDLIYGSLVLDPGRPYVDSSPSNGLYSRLPYIKRWGGSWEAQAGDVHYYNYEADCLDPETYPKARFVSEYGYQTFASYEVIRHYGKPSDFEPLSAFMQHRQRHPEGESQLLASLAAHFRQPPRGWDPSNSSSSQQTSTGCIDVPVPGDIYTCAQQASWGKCSADFIRIGNYCAATCKTCTASSTGSSGTAGSSSTGSSTSNSTRSSTSNSTGSSNSNSTGSSTSNSTGSSTSNSTGSSTSNSTGSSTSNSTGRSTSNSTGSSTSNSTGSSSSNSTGTSNSNSTGTSSGSSSDDADGQQRPTNGTQQTNLTAQPLPRTTNQTAQQHPTTNQTAQQHSTTNLTAHQLPSANQTAQQHPTANLTAQQLPMTNQTAQPRPATNTTTTNQTAQLHTTNLTAQQLPMTNQTAQQRPTTNMTNQTAPTMTGRELYLPWIYQLQVQQSLCYATAIGRWRSLRSDPRVMSMGVLYWQLNDIWPGYSWASLDYGGSWKPLHSTVRRVFAPVAVVASYYKSRSENVTAYVVNDSPDEVAVQLTVDVVSLAPVGTCPGGNTSTNSTATSCTNSSGSGAAGGADAARKATYAVLNLTATPQRSTAALDAPASQLLAALPNCSETTCVLLLRLQVLTPAGGAASDRLWPWGRLGPASDVATLVQMANWRNDVSGVAPAGGSGGSAAAAAAAGGGVGTDAGASPTGDVVADGMLPSVGLQADIDAAARANESQAAGGGGGSGAAAAAAPEASSEWWDWATSQEMVLLAPPKDLELSPPGIEVYDVQNRTLPGGGPSSAGPSYEWCFRLRARRAPALFVTLESSLPGTFSENLLPLLLDAANTMVPRSPTASAAPAAPNVSSSETTAEVTSSLAGELGNVSSSRLNNTAAQTSNSSRLNNTAAQTSNSSRLNNTAAQTSNSSRLNNTAAQTSNSSRLNNTAAQTSNSSRLNNTAAQTSNSSRLNNTAAQTSNSSRLNNTAAQTSNSSRLNNTAAQAGEILRRSAMDSGAAAAAAAPAAMPVVVVYDSDLAEAGASPRVCFRTVVDVPGGAAGFLTQLTVRDLYGMQTFT